MGVCARACKQVVHYCAITLPVKAGVFDVPDIYLALRAIGGMGMRVAFWYEPGCGMTPQHVADTYAEFALRLVGAGKPSPSLC